MLRPSLLLSLLSALLTADVSPSTASTPLQSGSPTAQNVPAEELSEDQKIMLDARRSLGNELRNL